MLGHRMCAITILADISKLLSSGAVSVHIPIGHERGCFPGIRNAANVRVQMARSGGERKVLQSHRRLKASVCSSSVFTGPPGFILISNSQVFLGGKMTQKRFFSFIRGRTFSPHFSVLRRLLKSHFFFRK